MGAAPKTINAPVGRVQLEPITAASVEALAALLQERNDTMRSYTRWKYGQHHDNRFRGVLATLDGAPVGCFGLVARDLVLPDCRRVPCGWFADWFVTSRIRAAGLGTEMLHEISKAYSLVFGHPVPEKARMICLTNGYRPIGFQSRRRLVFRRFEYERTRTHYVAKAAANWLVGCKRSTEARLRSFADGEGLRPLAHFADAEKQGDWILDQPVRLDVIRRGSAWEEVGFTVVFVDDQLPESGLRRRILYTSGHRQFSPEAWKPFLRASRDAGCLYLEGYTTQRALDNVWASFGAWRYPDAPVLMHGEPDVADQLFLHGWDRENWTYLAEGRTMADTVSVVIASYRRQSHLLKTLDQFVTQTHPPHEVFVVDASPVEERLTEAHIARYPQWLRYIVFTERGNASRQRNAALKQCTGDFVLFLDDDVEFGRDLISKYVQAFRETNADAINGTVLIPNEVPSRAPKLVRTIPIQYPGGPNYQAYDGIIETHVICSANFAATRKSLLAVGGFDEQLHGTRDDVDLGLRLVKKGFRVLHHNGPRLLHLMAKGNGSRSPEMGREWATANLFYFQFTHYWPAGKRAGLKWRTLWDYCRPSRHWLEPGAIVGRWSSVHRGYREATRRVNEGPKLCQ